MSLNDLHVQLATARPPLEKVRSRKGATFRALIETDEGRKRAYLKLLSVEDIAREVLCATLARKVHLPIRPCYYVEVDPSFVADDVYLNSESVAFGIEEDVYPSFRGNSQQLEAEILKWESALQCAVFDEWIFNKDRNFGNLVFVSNGVFWLIDHDEALPNYAGSDSSCGSFVLYKLAENLPELNRYRLKQLALRQVELYATIDWDEILDLVRPGALPPSEISYKKHIRFLKERVQYLPDIINESLGIRQRDLELRNSQGASKQTEKGDNESEK